MVLVLVLALDALVRNMISLLAVFFSVFILFVDSTGGWKDYRCLTTLGALIVMDSTCYLLE